MRLINSLSPPSSLDIDVHARSSWNFGQFLTAVNHANPNCKVFAVGQKLVGLPDNGTVSSFEVLKTTEGVKLNNCKCASIFFPIVSLMRRAGL